MSKRAEEALAAALDGAGATGLCKLGLTIRNDAARRSVDASLFRATERVRLARLEGAAIRAFSLPRTASVSNPSVLAAASGRSPPRPPSPSPSARSPPSPMPSSTPPPPASPAAAPLSQNMRECGVEPVPEPGGLSSWVYYPNYGAVTTSLSKSLTAATFCQCYRKCLADGACKKLSWVAQGSAEATNGLNCRLSIEKANTDSGRPGSPPLPTIEGDRRPAAAGQISL